MHLQLCVLMIFHVFWPTWLTTLQWVPPFLSVQKHSCLTLKGQQLVRMQQLKCWAFHADVLSNALPASDCFPQNTHTHTHFLLWEFNLMYMLVSWLHSCPEISVLISFSPACWTHTPPGVLCRGQTWRFTCPRCMMEVCHLASGLSTRSVCCLMSHCW